MGKILLEGLGFYAYHGVHPEERINGQQYELSLTLETDISKAIQSDSLNDTVDYSHVFQIVESEMAIPSNLLEHVAGRIVKRLHLTFSEIVSTEIKITKLQPPLKGNIAGVSVILFEKN